MVTRKYSDFESSEKVEGIIGSKVVESGKSESWQGRPAHGIGPQPQHVID
jgi:hypothetical protein